MAACEVKAELHPPLNCFLTLAAHWKPSPSHAVPYIPTCKSSGWHGRSSVVLDNTKNCV